MAELTALDGTWEGEVQQLRDGIYVTLLSPELDNERKAHVLRIPRTGDTWEALIEEYFLPVTLEAVSEGVKPQEALADMREAIREFGEATSPTHRE